MTFDCKGCRGVTKENYSTLLKSYQDALKLIKKLGYENCWCGDPLEEATFHTIECRDAKRLFR